MAGPVNAQSGSNGRVYTHPVTGETAASVTTILSGGVPKPALTSWAAKMAAEYAAERIEELATLVKSEGDVGRREAIDRIKGAPWRQRDNKADIGTAVHDVAEQIVLEGTNSVKVDDLGEDVLPYVRAVYRFWRDWKPEPIVAEATVWSREWGYAGTLDLIADIDGYGRCLLDWKTSKGIYGEVALQLAAYVNADFVLLDDGTEMEIPHPIDQVGAVHLRPDGSYAVHLIPVDAIEPHWYGFLYAREVAHWMREHSKVAIPSAAARPTFDGTAPAPPLKSKMLKADWLAEARRLNLDVSSKDTVKTIRAAVEAAR